MADNTTLNTGSGGDVISTDDIAGVKVQRVKVQYGADGSATDVAAAAPLPVDAAYRQSTTGTIVNSSSTVTLTGLTGGSATVFMYGTYAGVTVAFETSPDGSNWFTAIPLALHSTTVIGIATTAPGSNASAAYAIPLNGATQVRVRATAYTSGTANVVIVGNGYSPPVQRGIVDLNTGNTQTVSIGTSGSVTLVGTAQGTSVDSSSARTASGTGSNTTLSVAGGNVMGIWVILYVTAVSGTAPTLTFRLQHSFDGQSNWNDWDTTNLQTATISTTGTYFLKAGPGLPVVANTSANDPIPPVLRTAWTIGGTTPSFTFSSRIYAMR